MRQVDRRYPVHLLLARQGAVTSTSMPQQLALLALLPDCLFQEIQLGHAIFTPALPGLLTMTQTPLHLAFSA